MSTPKSKQTTLELRAESARSLFDLPCMNSKFKILIVGNANCGKTSIVERFVSNDFSELYQSTVGADFRKKNLNWSTLGDGKIAEKVKLHVFDIAGQDRFARLTRSYFNNANGALVVCDVTREGTFEAAGEWKRELDRTLTTYDDNGRSVKIPVVLVANKCDLLNDVASSFVAGAKMESACRQHGFAGWFVTSAKMGDNVESCMCFLSRQMLAARDIQRAKIEQNFLKTVADTGFGGGGSGGSGGSGGGGGATRAYYVDEEVEDLMGTAKRGSGTQAMVGNPYLSAEPTHVQGLRMRGGGKKNIKKNSCC